VLNRGVLRPLFAHRGGSASTSASSPLPPVCVCVYAARAVQESFQTLTISHLGGPAYLYIDVSRGFQGRSVGGEQHNGRTPACAAQPSCSRPHKKFNRLDTDPRLFFARTQAGSALVFECESDGTYVAINHMSHEPSAGHPSESYYTVRHGLGDGRLGWRGLVSWEMGQGWVVRQVHSQPTSANTHARRTLTTGTRLRGTGRGAAG
jgi:hypothetical protein